MLVLRLVKVVFLLLMSFLGSSLSQRGTNYPLKFQPELDSLDMGLYFRNERLMKLQIMCIFYAGPCDIAGRWLKPRMIPGLFGDCPACSPFQKKVLPDWLWIFADRYPLKFRAVVAQWLMDQGYPVPFDEVPRIMKAMGFVDPDRIINPTDVINSTYDGALATRQFKTQPALYSYLGLRRG